jgi:hypothetical protein
MIFAVGVAAAAALESSNAVTPEDVRRFLAAAFEPQTTDADSDPLYMTGVATGDDWLPVPAAYATPNGR